MIAVATGVVSSMVSSSLEEGVDAHNRLPRRPVTVQRQLKGDERDPFPLLLAAVSEPRAGTRLGNLCDRLDVRLQCPIDVGRHAAVNRCGKLLNSCSDIRVSPAG